MKIEIFWVQQKLGGVMNFKGKIGRKRSLGEQIWGKDAFRGISGGEEAFGGF